MEQRTKLLKEGEIIPLTFDYMFTGIFNKEENIDILEEFISFYLDIELKEIKGNLKLLSRDLELENKNQAGRRVDLLLDYKGKKINIELSNYMSKYIIERNIVYACSVHSRQLKYQDTSYKKIEKTIQINLLGYNSKQKSVKESYYLKNDNGDKLSEKLEIDIIDMEKGKKMWYTEPTNKLAGWCKLFMSRNAEELEESRKGIMENKVGEKLESEVRKLSEDNEMVELYTKLSRDELERNTYIEEAKEIGHEEGFKSGLEEGIKEGRKEGRKEGIEQGVQQNKKEIAKEMLKLGIDKEQISQITKLTIEQLNEMC